jgi:hypothetical protein
MLDVYQGRVKRTATGPDGETPPFWNSIKGGYLPGGPDWAFDLVVGGDSPADVNVLTVLAAEPAEPTE